MVDELVEKISEESGADPDDIKERIAAKTEELSGLVSEEGAAHLIAREEGVELAEAEEQELKVENVVPGMNRVDLKAQVVDITDINTFERDDGEEGRVRNIVLGDETGTVRMSLWDDQVDLAEKVDVDDAIGISGAYSREDNRGNPELRIGDDTQIRMIDEDIEAVDAGQGGGGGGAVEAEKITDVVSENQTVTVHGTVVEVYAQNPFYQACPECNKKVEEDGDGYVCGEHGEVEPQHNMILSAILDDGYGNIRTVFFRDRAKELLQAEDETFDGDAEAVQGYADDIKGRDVVVTGRSRYNDFFNRIELIGNEVAFETAQDRIEALLADVNAHG